jgi:hypothetical protein
MEVQYLNMLSECISSVIDELLNGTPNSKDTNISDLIDGRLFHNVVTLAPLNSNSKPTYWKVIGELFPTLANFSLNFSKESEKQSQEYLQYLKNAASQYQSNYDQGNLYKFENEVGNLIMPGICWFICVIIGRCDEEI